MNIPIHHKTVLIGGGVRSGKSRFAMEMALELGEQRTFIATAQSFDMEMGQRIKAHQLERADRFSTLEVPVALPEALSDLKGADVVVVDCLTLWMSNLLLAGLSDEAIQGKVLQLTAILKDPPCHILLVSNEVGMGIVPDNALARRFRDIAGSTHQSLATVCDEVYLAAMGLLLQMKPVLKLVEQRPKGV